MKKKKNHPFFFYLIIISAIYINSQNFVASTYDSQNYKVKDGDAFIWRYDDFDFIQQKYFLKFTIAYRNSTDSFIGYIETYYTNSNVSINETEQNITNFSPEFELGFFHSFDFFDNNFNNTLFYSINELQSLSNNEDSKLESIEIAEKQINCIKTKIDNREIWIDNGTGIVVKIEYANLFNFELVSWQNADLKDFADNYEKIVKIQWIFYTIFSIGVVSVIIGIHLFLRNRGKKKLMEKCNMEQY